MSKLKCVIYAPFDCYAGYGANSRDKIKSIINLKKEEWDIKLISCGWGQTPQGFVNDHPKEWGFLLDHLLPTPQLQYQPDIWIMITVPNEYQKVGKFNIGFNAGIETTICDASWLEGMNRMDLNVVSSQHSKNVYVNSRFEKKDKNTNQTIGIVQLEKPIQVLFEGVDLDVYKPIEKSEIKNLNSLDIIEEDFCYLFVGHWIGNTPIGEDRKNVGLLVKAFYETFKNKKKQPALILKTSAVGSSYVDRDFILKKLEEIRDSIQAKQLPNVYLLHGDLKDNEINELYNHPKIKAMVHLAKGEGFGRPLLEFSMMKKPIICSGWSGPLDFLNQEFVKFLPGQLTPIHPSAQVPNMLIEGSQWFSPDLIQVNNALVDVFENYKNWKEKATRQAYVTKTKFSTEKMKEELDVIFNSSLPDFPKPIKLKLPESLKKISLPKREKIEDEK